MQFKVSFFIVSLIITAWCNEEVLKRYIDRVLEKNPHLRTLEKRTEAMQVAIRSKKAIPNPMVTMGTPINSDMKMYELTFSQSIPWPGEIVAKKKIASRAFESFDEYLKDEKNDVLFELRKECVNLFTIDQKIKYLNENVEYLKEAEKVIRINYTTGKNSQMPILKIGLEISLTKDKIDQLKTEMNVIKSNLSELLELSIDNIEVIDRLPGMSVPSLENSIKLSIEQNPEINSFEQKIRVAEENLLLAKQKLGPQFVASTKYKSADDEWSIMGGVSVPIWAAPKVSEIKEKKLLLEAAKEELEKKKADLENMTASMHFNYVDAKRQIELLDKELIPIANQTFELAMVNYTSGQSSLLEMLDALRMANDLRMKKADQEARREIMAAEIVICCLGRG